MLTLPAPPLHTTWKGSDPAAAVAMRAAELPGIVALPVRDLDPGIRPPLWALDEAWGQTDVEAVRERTRARLRRLDLSRIGAGETVNLLANPHGFALCGPAYVVLLEETQKYVTDRTGARVRVRIAESMGHIENPDWVKIYDLDARLGPVKEVPQIDRGIEVETRIGKFWLSRPLFAADHFIHTHVTEMREGYLHRMLDRLHKPFGMGYTRIETRSAYHFGYGPRTGQIVSRAVFESDFVQSKYVGTIVLDTSPEGVVDVDADNDLDVLNRRVSANILRTYGPLMRLLGEIDEMVVLFDGPGCFVYAYAAGMPFDNLLYAAVDFLDLDNLALLSAFTSKLPTNPGLFLSVNPGIKGIVVNYMPGGVPFTSTVRNILTVLVDGPAAGWLINDPSNAELADVVEVAPALPEALARVQAEAGTDQVIVYDSLPGAFHVSESLAGFLRDRAPAVVADVESRLLPKWLEQRDLHA
ncbi:hypothetical protein [Cryptosporangium aurantiacum]|uniref:Uncharacterized protein n=1 Tax=Cryptosporangium aurantiacum TaxID=134849 RepID=A0A1M7PEH7_9ACTN|nr:hypothetical protein [Cryptosporangium aurantiacum]SHN15375.1 hypothetical protein SAMN05443668_103272 [Cryptosporangium aurantiacum]